MNSNKKSTCRGAARQKVHMDTTAAVETLGGLGGCSLENSRRAARGRLLLPVRTVCCECGEVHLQLFHSSTVSSCSRRAKGNLGMIASDALRNTPPTHAAIKKVHHILDELEDSKKVTELRGERGVHNFFLEPKNRPRQRSTKSERIRQTSDHIIFHQTARDPTSSATVPC